MPSSLQRKALRAAMQRAAFVTDGTQRIVEGVRYDIVPLPSAQWSERHSLVANAFNAAQAKRDALLAEDWPVKTRAPKQKVSEGDCDFAGCDSCASHYTSRGNFCREHRP